MLILGGRFKGRTLLAPPAAAPTRPITSFVKKSLFDIVSGWLPGATVADLYCGTGTMGLEAMSRGAKRCYFAEFDRGALRGLRENIETLKLGDYCMIWAGDLTLRLGRWLAAADSPVDLAFVDPPYRDARQWSWPWACDTIFTPLAGSLAAEGLVILRLPIDAKAPPTLGPLSVLRTREYGDMQLVFLGRQADLDAESDKQTPSAGDAGG